MVRRKIPEYPEGWQPPVDQQGRLPVMVTIREAAMAGPLSEYALRKLLKKGRLPAVYVGNRALINYDQYVRELTELRSHITATTGSEPAPSELPWWKL